MCKTPHSVSFSDFNLLRVVPPGQSLPCVQIPAVWDSGAEAVHALVPLCLEQVKSAAARALGSFTQVAI